MSEAQATIDVATIEEIVGDFEPICEGVRHRNGVITGTCSEPARWILFIKPHGGGCKLTGPRLHCDSDKEKRLMNTTRNGRTTCPACGTIFSPAASAYSRIEPL